MVKASDTIIVLSYRHYFLILMCEREREDGENNPVRVAIQIITDANGKSPQDCIYKVL